MEIKVHGRHTEISDSLERFAEEKLSRLTKYGPAIQLIDVELYQEGRLKNGSHFAEVAVTCKGLSFRAKTCAADYRAAIDIALDRLSRQMTESKRRRQGKPAHARHGKEPAAPAMLDLASLNAAAPMEPAT
ncbi:MAG TPA: ribosome-associated translation inhibitor RaiA [Actinomycetota bacterium]|nr:ribosome-associated translation inhibitor RaiA [Actinomycetota bacterium]